MTGGNGGAWLIQQARREERRRQRDWQKRRQKSRARNLAKRRARATQGAFQPQREDFPCEFLCADCGCLLGEPTPRCPSCRSESILDLADVEVASRLRELEEPDTEAHETALTSWLGAGAGAAALGTAAALLLHPLAGLASLAAFPLLLTQLLPKLQTRQLQSGLVPTRWRLPAAPQQGQIVGPQIVVGRARGAERMQAPISGASCIAWRVTVADAGAERRQRTFLDECRTGDVGINGHQLAAGSYLLDATANATSQDADGVSHYLRTRGLFAASRQFRVREAVLREGEWVELCGGHAPTVRRPLPVVRG